MSLLLTESKVLDIAIVGHFLNPIEHRDVYHIIELDNILIDETVFKSLFYYYDQNNFAVLPSISEENEKYISFESKYRTYKNGQPFNLLHVIIGFIEEDLHIKRDCFDTSCRMELEKQLSAIKNITDLEICNVLCSLKWDEVIDVLKTKGAHSKTTDGKNIPHLLKVNIVFKNPNSNVRDVIVKFNYVLDYIEGLNFVQETTKKVATNDYSTNINSTTVETPEEEKNENENENQYNENTITNFNVFKSY